MGKPTLLQKIPALLLLFAFALLLAVSIYAILIGSSLEAGRLIRIQENRTMMICAEAAFFSAFIVWGLQIYAAKRNILVRFFYALLMLFVVFGAVGGTLVILHNYFIYPDSNVTSLVKGLYWESMDGFYSFAVFIITEASLALLGLFVAAAIFIAMVGPQMKEEDISVKKLGL